MAAQTTIYPVLLCGGTGERLWPLSRQSYPKQFIALAGEHSLFQMAALRMQGQTDAPLTVVTAEAYRFIVTQQLSAIGMSEAFILIEPERKNTAAAIAAAALMLCERDPEALMLVMPCDHVIPDVKQFRQRVRIAVDAARQGRIVTFGIRPTRPETGYGWLELLANADAKAGAQPLGRFVEKPNAKAASDMLASGMHLWNSGIFLFTAPCVLQAYAAHCPALLGHVKDALEGREDDLGFTRLAAPAWKDLPDISFDYAIMEKVERAAVVPFEGEWSDLGDWQAIWRHSAQPDADTVRHGAATAIDCEQSLLFSADPQQELVGIGLSDIVAVAMPDAVLVAHKSRVQDVKQAVSALQAKHKRQAHCSRRDYRPWGWFECIAAGERFQVKCINVYPKASLSLQKHERRAEHWVVVAGEAKVTIDTQVSVVRENESTYIPLGSKHRLENDTQQMLTLIEVQTGAYLGEDDIIRYDDHYARR